MAITASVQPESGRIVYAGSDFPHPFQLRFSEEGMGHIAQNRPGSDLGGLVIIWPKRIWSGSKRVCRNQQARFLPDRYRPATSSHFQTRFCSSTDVTDNIVQNHPGSDLVLADRVRFCLNRSGPEAGRCAKSIWPASGQCFPVDPDRRRIASGMFTEVVDWMMAAVFRRSSARCPTAVLAAKVSNRMTASCSCSKSLKQNDC